MLELSGGSELWFGQVCLVIFDADEVVAATREVRGHPGFVAFASDGGPMIFGYDARVATCPVVMIHPTSGGWHEALYQAASIAELLATRANGLPLRWDQRYEAEA